jgi:broad specificity phosphatase PhoE
MIYLMLPAPNIYDRAARACSWKHTPTARTALKELKPLLPRLRELGILKVVSSDLDSDTRDYLTNKLRVTGEEWSCLRRRNAGKLHGQPLDKLDNIWDNLDKPDVPIKGGDSHTSYQKRIAAARARINGAANGTLLVAGARELNAILGTNAPLEPYRVYEYGQSAQTL